METRVAKTAMAVAGGRLLRQLIWLVVSLMLGNSALWEGDIPKLRELV